MLPDVLAIALLFSGAAQNPPPAPDAMSPVPLVYTGKPVVVPFRCSSEDIDWAGMTCSEADPCPVYLELSAADATGRNIFVAGNLHSDAVTLYSILLRSADEGHTWQEAYKRIRGAGLDRLGLAGSKGWATGETLVPLPRDPFLLLTTDGGETWRQQPVFPDGGRGSILQIEFSGKAAGNLVVDRGPGAEGGRYARYESPDGGVTWAIREENSQPIRLPLPVEQPEWRVRADGASKSFLVERRGGDRWTRVAAFAVRAAACDRAESEAGGTPIAR